MLDRLVEGGVDVCEAVVIHQWVLIGAPKVPFRPSPGGEKGGDGEGVEVARQNAVTEFRDAYMAAATWTCAN